MTTKRHRNSELRRTSKKQSGFTLIEVMISICILTIGLVGMLSLFGVALAATHDARQDLIAKQEANEAVEMIFSARNVAEVTWAQIQNVSNGGIFLDNYQPILDPGPDGIDGTADDVYGNVTNASCPGPSQCLQLAGPDGVLGTADDTYLPLNNFQRQILITPYNNPDGSVNPSLRQVTVNIKYVTSQYRDVNAVYSITSYISQYR